MADKSRRPMNIALVLSGGIGTRLISEVSKQYVMVRGKMVVIYCLQKHYVMQRLEEGKIKLEKLIVHKLAMEEFGEGLDMMRDNREDYCKVMGSAMT